MKIINHLRVLVSYMGSLVIFGVAVMLMMMPGIFTVVAGAWIALGLIGFWIFRFLHLPFPRRWSLSWTLADTALVVVFSIFGPVGLLASITHIFKGFEG